MPIKCIIGLGNPGEEYGGTRHNIGFSFIRALNRESTVSVGKNVKCQSQLYDPQLNGRLIRTVLPQTYMNRSGEAVAMVMRYYQLSLSDICVVTDDLDVAFGRWRIRSQGGAGTHNGMKSVIHHLGSSAFMRIRLGIGPKPEGMDSADFVLRPFSVNEREALPTMLHAMVQAFIPVMDESVENIMNRLNPMSFLDGGTDSV